MARFREIPTPGTWLRQALADRGLSQRQFALQLGVDVAQFNNWVKGHQPIPEASLAHACRYLGQSDSQTQLVLNSAKCHKALADLQRFTARRAEQDETLAFLPRLEETLIDKAETLALQAQSPSPPDTLATLARFVTDAQLVIGLLIALTDDASQSLLNRDNAILHLQQPMNTFVGSVMALTTSSSLPSLVTLGKQIHHNLTLLAKHPKDDDIRTIFAHHHAVHMLARHGQPSDKEYISSYVNNPDVLLRRMALFGLSIGGDENIQEELFHQIRTNAHFAKAVVVFDAVHYGDLPIARDGFPSSWFSLERSISNILGYIKRDENIDNSDLNLLKLINIICQSGPSPFMHLHWRIINDALNTIRHKKDRTAVQIEFLSVFDRALRDQDSTLFHLSSENINYDYANQQTYTLGSGV